MELQIQNLVSSIKKQGIEAAEKEAEQIINAAKKQAQKIIQKANFDAEKILEKATKETDILRQSAITSAEHAKRDAMLGLKEEVNKIYGFLLKREVSKVLSSDKELVSLIHAIVTDKDACSFSAEVAKVSETLKEELADEIKKGMKIKPVSDINAGFRLVSSDGSGYFDCSDEELSEIISHYMGF